jgi:hypothetical protein
MSVIAFTSYILLHYIDEKEGENSLTTFFLSLINMIFLLPFLFWIQGVRDLSPFSEAHFIAAMLLDIVVYAYLMELVYTKFRDWKNKRY